jgi:hypothetical protein
MAAMARDGQKIAGSAPYGYKRNSENRLIPDKYAASTVKRIFNIRKKGNGYTSIVKTLNAENILPPRLYNRNKSGKNGNIKTRLWTVSTVQAMLRNEIYIGNAVQLIRKIVSYRDKREVMNSPEKHIRIENAFPAIITRKTWEAVQEINSRAAKKFAKKKPPQKQLFSGMLYCSDCNAPLICRRASRKNEKEYITYFCKTFGTTSTGCTRHTISETALKQIVGEQLRRLLRDFELDKDAVIFRLMNVGRGNLDTPQEQRLLKQKIHKLEQMTETLYEARITGALTEASYSEAARKNETELSESKNRLTLLELTEQGQYGKFKDVHYLLDLIRQNAEGFKSGELTRDLLESIIQRIEIGEGTQNRAIKIIYKL